MAKEEKKVIVIKKITEAGHGHHGGAWKVAFADFMTAMMCFFLVMWLLNQSEETKKQVASYFTGPSMIEHQFTSYGAELTLEKLFLDLVNQPLKTAQEFMQPADFTPNLMSMGSKKIVMQQIAQELGEMASNVNIESDSVTFEIPDRYLFERGSNKPSAQFINTMKKIEAVTQGLEYSVVDIRSNFFYTDSAISDQDAEWVAKSRLDLIQNKVKSGFEHESNDVIGTSKASKNTASQTGTRSGMITFEIKQKEFLPDGRKPRKLEDVFDSKVEGSNPYDTFVKRATKSKKENRKK
ncbi:MAG: flagellar motor protein MotB [Bdellovibrionota bacterium]